ncbi:hypothetical protein GCM10027361_26040 [Erwinia aphidicola]
MARVRAAANGWITELDTVPARPIFSVTAPIADSTEKGSGLSVTRWRTASTTLSP